MPSYEIEVVETRNVRVIYTVDAESAAEAEEKAVSGTTSSEVEQECIGVIERTVLEAPVEALKDEADMGKVDV